VSQPGLELGHFLAFTESGRNFAELGASTRADHDPFAVAVAHNRSHERA